MESECNTETLRSLAPRWSLAGDEKLLNILQNTHKNIVSKCQEVNSKLEQMSAALDDASICLQNVNNKFMALSNSQFIESRVYDDDADVSTEIPPVQETPPKPQTQDIEQTLKDSLSVLQEFHEAVTILKDSDTETDSDGDDGDRVVLKPKDLYLDRPLPYIIGSQAWKNSWHAGLIPEDSDTESGSVERPHSPQYSDSEPEDAEVQSKANATISECSSDLASEQDTSVPAPKSTPADIAADLARRLGGHQPRLVDPEAEYSPPKTTSKTVYKPHQPQTGTIFTDEPPPLDSQTESSEEDDIFAELHKPKERVVEDIFGGRGLEVGKVVAQPRIEKKPLFDEDPDEFEDTPPVKRTEEEKSISKKPVGGISLFGTKQGAESIGASILKRNQRRSTSEEETDSEGRQPPRKSKSIDQTDSMKTEKDIFENLFAKSEKLEKKKQVEKDSRSEVKKSDVKSVEKERKVDLFSDNLFDDVGDIFTSNVMKNKSNQKSIFDDDDDLFADIAPVASKVSNKTNEGKVKESKSIFDSDDELFAEKSTIIAKSSKETTKINHQSDLVGNKNSVQDPISFTNTTKPVTNTIDTKSVNNKANTKATVVAKSIFDSDSDSDIFSSLVKNKDTGTIRDKKDIFDIKTDKVETYDIFKNTSEVEKDLLIVGDKKTNLRSPSLFDDDDDELFGGTLTDKSRDPKTTSKVLQHTNILGESEISTIKTPISHESEKSVSTTDIPIDHSAEKSLDFTTNIESKQSDVFINNDNDVPETNESDTSDHRNDGGNKKEKLVENSEKREDPSVYDIPDDDLFITKETELNDSLTEIKETSVSEHDDLTHHQTDSELNKANLMPVTDENNHLDEPLPIIHDTYIGKDILFQKQESLISKEVFDDEPPVFEKPKEPKRSKNINALFDDDSEDEALFFRKSDMDDKSESFPSTVRSDQLFGIFHDEPPAIDDFGKDEDADIFSSVSQSGISKDANSDTFTGESKFTGDFIDTPPELSVGKIPENKTDITVSKLGIQSIAKLSNDDELFETETPVQLGSDSRTNNIHEIPTEIKENEVDDIFKAASKVTSVDNDELFKLSIDDLIKTTESVRIEPENIPITDNSHSKSSEKEIISEKHDIDFDSDEELFRTLPKPDKPKVPEVKPSDEVDKRAVIKEDIIDINNKLDDKSLFKYVDIVKEKKFEEVQHTNEVLDDLDQIPELRKKETDHNSNQDLKKVGRIKSLNLNIDVSKLLPGASPKKHKVETPKEDTMSDTTPEKIIKRITPEEIIKRHSPESDSKMVKSISFEGEPTSEVLDNKLSKERARIQVKRRPSTRKARREAVRKSVIDLDDSTDNSSSVDDHPKSIESPVKVIKTAEESSLNIEKANKPIIDNKEKDLKLLSEHIKTTIDKVPEKPKVTSKIVYILNDEDIFDTKPNENELLKTDTVIPTLGSMYGNASNQPVISKKVAKKPSKVSIFDSDSDEELFGGKSRPKKKVEMKSSLFDDEADEDLFGVKSKKADTSKPATSKSTANVEKSEPVFNDPLSIFDDD